SRPERARARPGHADAPRAGAPRRGVRGAGGGPVRTWPLPVSVQAGPLRRARARGFLHLGEWARDEPGGRRDRRRRVGRCAVVRRKRDAELLALGREPDDRAAYGRSTLGGRAGG